MNILVLNGPNLNLLGSREIEIYGEETLDELCMWIETSQEGRDHDFKFYQSNHEGDLIDTLHDEREWANGIIPLFAEADLPRSVPCQPVRPYHETTSIPCNLVTNWTPFIPTGRRECGDDFDDNFDDLFGDDGGEFEQVSFQIICY